MMVDVGIPQRYREKTGNENVNSRALGHCFMSVSYIFMTVTIWIWFIVRHRRREIPLNLVC